MRILHTADWHFGRLLEGRERRAEQEQFVDELCCIAEERQVDLVLIAGDVYDSVNPPAWAEELFYEAVERLSNEGRRGVVVIAGNHDQPERVRAAAPLARKQGIVLLGLPKEVPLISEIPAHSQREGDRQDLEQEHERVWVLNAGPSWLEMAIPGVRQPAVILALPYPSEARLKELISERFEQAEMQQAFSDRIAALFSEMSQKFRPDTVNLVMSHLFVIGGSESDSERPIQIGGTHSVALSAFPPNADYVALGHLHRPQKLSDAPLIRYSGSPLAFSFSEAGQSKAVMLIDVELQNTLAGGESTPQKTVHEEMIYLQSGRPLVRWRASEGIAQVEKWIADGRDAGCLIDLEVVVSDVIDPAEFQRLRKLSDDFVRIQRVLVQSEQTASDPAQAEKRETMSPEQLFVRFFERKRGADPDPKLLELFSRLMAGPANEPEQLEDAQGLAAEEGELR